METIGSTMEFIYQEEYGGEFIYQEEYGGEECISVVRLYSLRISVVRLYSFIIIAMLELLVVMASVLTPGHLQR